MAILVRSCWGTYYQFSDNSYQYFNSMCLLYQNNILFMVCEQYTTKLMIPGIHKIICQAPSPVEFPDSSIEGLVSIQLYDLVTELFTLTSNSDCNNFDRNFCYNPIVIILFLIVTRYKICKCVEKSLLLTHLSQILQAQNY